MSFPYGNIGHQGHYISFISDYEGIEAGFHRKRAAVLPNAMQIATMAHLPGISIFQILLGHFGMGAMIIYWNQDIQIRTQQFPNAITEHPIGGLVGGYYFLEMIYDHNSFRYSFRKNSKNTVLFFL